MFVLSICCVCGWKASGADVLAQLVGLLKEFYSTTDNSRKKEIGKTLCIRLQR